MILYRGTQTPDFRLTREGVLTWSTHASEAALYALPDGYVTKAAVNSEHILDKRESWLMEGGLEVTTCVNVPAQILWIKPVSSVPIRKEARDLEVY